MSSKAIFLVLCASVLLSTGTTHAALFDRGNGLIYDDVLNVTWLQDANYAQTSGYDPDGRMTWNEATLWAATLSYGGLDDWRLPSVGPINHISFNPTYSDNATSDFGYNITSPVSEMGYMHYTNLSNGTLYAIGGTRTGCYELIPNRCMYNSAPFQNLMADVYWSGTELQQGSDSAFHFNMSIGLQYASTKDGSENFAWAVRDGDVASSSVPEPTTIALSLLALAGLGFGRLHSKRGNGTKLLTGFAGKRLLECSFR